MTQDEIVEMARQAGWSGIYSSWTSPTNRISLTVPVTIQQIEAFAKLIAAKEREALAQEQEPVAWMHVQGNYKEPSFRELADDEVERGWEQYPLYTAPSQRQWKGLTNEELTDLFYNTNLGQQSAVLQAIALLKQKNGYAEENNT